MMESENLFEKTIGEIERMLSTKTVVGDPISVDGYSLIPLVSVGFGFGVGAGFLNAIRVALETLPLAEKISTQTVMVTLPYAWFEQIRRLA